jgi:hypothetical protein
MKAAKRTNSNTLMTGLKQKRVTGEDMKPMPDRLQSGEGTLEIVKEHRTDPHGHQVN